MSVQYVRIYYGPNDSYHTVLHRPQKLRGVREQLLKLGFRVDLIPVEFIEYCMLEMCGHEVFRCNIKNLSFNTPAERDPVSQRAIRAVIESSAKFLRARNYVWCWALIDELIFRREFAPQDYWPFNVNESFSMNLECVTCCGILKKQSS